MYGVTAFAVLHHRRARGAADPRRSSHSPNGTVLNAAQYNQIFTMHGLTMIFLFVMPMSAAFFNYLIPLMIGARDVAFPRLNAFSYWVFLLGGLFLYSSWFLGGAPNGGWFGYAPNSTTDPSHRHDVLRARPADHRHRVDGRRRQPRPSRSSTCARPGCRCSGCRCSCGWGSWCSSCWCSRCRSSRSSCSSCCSTAAGARTSSIRPQGGDPVLWQHLFWLFGHPEVYILILPAFGIFSEVLPVFSRKPLFGYQFVVFSGIAIGFIGFGVWAHHMFAVGLGPVANTAFGISTAIIAIPTGVKIFNWMATMYGGDLRFDTPDAVLGRRCGDVRHRRAVRRDARDRAGRLPADGHVLHRGALPLRALRRRDLRAVLGRRTTGGRRCSVACSPRARASCTSGS